MNPDQQFKLQAYLDHELSSAESERVAEWIAKNDTAQALFEELRQTKSLLMVNEPERKLPESRDFYWSKIRRGLEAQPAERPAGGFWEWPSWVRVAIPGAAVAVGLLVAFLVSTQDPGRTEELAESFHEIESPLGEANAITFHSHEARMTVVWIDTSGD